MREREKKERMEAKEKGGGLKEQIPWLCFHVFSIKVFLLAPVSGTLLITSGLAPNDVNRLLF